MTNLPQPSEEIQAKLINDEEFQNLVQGVKSKLAADKKHLASLHEADLHEHHNSKHPPYRTYKRRRSDYLTRSREIRLRQPESESPPYNADSAAPWGDKTDLLLSPRPKSKQYDMLFPDLESPEMWSEQWHIQNGQPTTETLSKAGRHHRSSSPRPLTQPFTGPAALDFDSWRYNPAPTYGAKGKVCKNCCRLDHQTSQCPMRNMELPMFAKADTQYDYRLQPLRSSADRRLRDMQKAKKTQGSSEDTPSAPVEKAMTTACFNRHQTDHVMQFCPHPIASHSSVALDQSLAMSTEDYYAQYAVSMPGIKTNRVGLDIPAGASKDQARGQIAKIPERLLEDLESIDLMNRLDQIERAKQMRKADQLGSLTKAQAQDYSDGVGETTVQFALPVLWNESRLMEIEPREDEDMEDRDPDPGAYTREWLDPRSRIARVRLDDVPVRMYPVRKRPQAHRTSDLVTSLQQLQPQQPISQGQNLFEWHSSQQDLEVQVEEAIKQSHEDRHQLVKSATNAITFKKQNRTMRRKLRLQEMLYEYNHRDMSKKSQKDLGDIQELQERIERKGKSYRGFDRGIPASSRPKRKSSSTEHHESSSFMNVTSRPRGRKRAAIDMSAMNLDGSRDNNDDEPTHAAIGHGILKTSQTARDSCSEHRQVSSSPQFVASTEGSKRMPLSDSIFHSCHRLSNLSEPHEDKRTEWSTQNMNKSLATPEPEACRPAKRARMTSAPAMPSSPAGARLQQQIQELTEERDRLVSAFPVASIPMHHFNVGIVFAHFYALKQSGTDDAAQDYWRSEIARAAAQMVRERIGKLHRYNAVRDAAEKLMGMVAQATGVGFGDVVEELGEPHEERL